MCLKKQSSIEIFKIEIKIKKPKIKTLILGFFFLIHSRYYFLLQFKVH